MFYTVIGLIVGLALAAGRRSFCHHGCWMAPFMILGTKIRNIFKWPALHLKADKDEVHHLSKMRQGMPDEFGG